MVAIFVVLTFLLFIGVDFLVLRAQKKEHPAFASESSAVFSKRNIFAPLEVYLSAGHTWAKAIKESLVRIGVDDFAAKALGRMQLVSLVSEGSFVKQGEPVFEGRIHGKSVYFRSPIDGKVRSVNRSLEGRAVENPYDEDWGIEVEANNLTENEKSLKSGKQGSAWLKEEFTRLKDFLSVNTANSELAGLTMADGGNVTEGAVSNLNEQAVKSFENEFLKF
jgi:glycine cleavage system H lipoate-binding protein